MRGTILVTQIAIRDYSPRTYGEDDREKKKQLTQLILSKITDPSTAIANCRGKLLSIEVVFYLAKDKESGSPRDLDNMLKILLDTFPDYLDQARTEHGLGLIEGKSDHVIYEIHCVKKLVQSEDQEGIDVEIHEWVDP